MTRSKFEIFLIISIIFHVILIYYFKLSSLSINTKKIKKIKEKTPIKVKFIDLPENLPEIKHNQKTPYIAQKSFKAEKNIKKENPLIKRKSVVIKDTIPNFLKAKPQLPKKAAKSIKSTVKPKKKIIQKVKPKKNLKEKKAKKISKKKEIISLNKINPTFEELLKSNIIDKKREQKEEKIDNKSQKSANNFKSNPELLAPGIFRPSHIYPDDIDIGDSISISTQSSRYASYLHKVKRKIELVWEYPPLAGEMGIQGRLFVKFEIDNKGNLKMVKLLKSSGAKILDNEALRAIREAAPYPPFPPDFKVKSIKIHACFDYIIVGKEIW